MSNENFPPELQVEVIKHGVAFWNKNECLNVAQVSKAWKRDIQRLRCEHLSIGVLTGYCPLLSTDRIGHRGVICVHESSFYQFWKKNHELGLSVRTLEMQILHLEGYSSVQPGEVRRMFPQVETLIIRQPSHLTTLFVQLEVSRIVELKISEDAICLAPAQLIQLLQEATSLSILSLVFNSVWWPAWCRDDKEYEEVIGVPRPPLHYLEISLAQVPENWSASGTCGASTLFQWLIRNLGLVLKGAGECRLTGPVHMRVEIDEFVTAIAPNKLIKNLVNLPR